MAARHVMAPQNEPKVAYTNAKMQVIIRLLKKIEREDFDRHDQVYFHIRKFFKMCRCYFKGSIAGEKWY